jgi:uncharacterized protein (TIGR02444 family)
MKKTRDNSNVPALDPDVFWRFSISLYGESSIKELCLSLQDQHSADVNLMLLYVWLDQQNISITSPERESLEALSNEWQTHWLHPLRKQRKTLGRTAPEYKAILQQELELERREQQALIQCANAFNLTRQQQTITTYRNINMYLSKIGSPPDIYLAFKKYAENII